MHVQQKHKQTIFSLSIFIRKRCGTDLPKALIAEISLRFIVQDLPNDTGMLSVTYSISGYSLSAATSSCR